MTVNQISIFLEKQIREIKRDISVIGRRAHPHHRATVADTSEYGILRIIVSDPQKAYKILKETTSAQT